MLSPHEFATLMLVNDGHEQGHLDRAELETLHRQQLITLDHPGTSYQRAQLTARGDLVLRVIIQIR